MVKLDGASVRKKKKWILCQLYDIKNAFSIVIFTGNDAIKRYIWICFYILNMYRDLVGYSRMKHLSFLGKILVDEEKKALYKYKLKACRIYFLSPAFGCAIQSKFCT